VIVRIDGTEVDPDAVGPPALNYGQLERWEGCPRRTYEYVVPHDEFARLAASWWDGSCDELRDDLPFRTLGDFPELDALEQLDYPPLTTMLREHREALAAFLRWDDLGLLGLVGGSQRRGPVLYVASSLESLNVSETEIRFSGLAFETIPSRLESSD
jgi:hypothetical protein